MSRKRAAWVGVPLVLVALLAAWGFWGYSYDDNFITYRYAENLRRGEGLVFNPGERVLGTTAPGWAVLLAALAAVGAPVGLGVPQWGTLVSVAALVALAALLAAALARAGQRCPPSVPPRGRADAAIPAFGFAALAAASRVDLHLLGAEAFPLLALVAAAAYLLFVRDAPLASGVLVGLAMGLRLDAGLAAAALGLVEWRRRRRFPHAYAAAGLALLAGWTLGLAAYFGRVIPNTIGGKKALLEVPYTLREWQVIRMALPWPSAVVLLAGAVAGLVVCWRQGWWRRPAVQALGGWIVAHEVAYRAVGVWFAPWYFLHLWHAILALYAVAAWSLASRFAASRFAVRQRIVAAFATVALLAPVLVPSLGWAAARWRRPPDASYAIYRAAGEYLAEHTAPGSTVLALEIGVLGYFAERPILDYGALVSPRFTAAKFAGTRPRLAAELEPDYIVTIAGNRMIEEVLEEPGIAGRYVEAATFEDPGFPPGTVTIWKRHDGP